MLCEDDKSFSQALPFKNYNCLSHCGRIDYLKRSEALSQHRIDLYRCERRAPPQPRAFLHSCPETPCQRNLVWFLNSSCHSSLSREQAETGVTLHRVQVKGPELAAVLPIFRNCELWGSWHQFITQHPLGKGHGEAISSLGNTFPQQTGGFMQAETRHPSWMQPSFPVLDWILVIPCGGCGRQRATRWGRRGLLLDDGRDLENWNNGLDPAR